MFVEMSRVSASIDSQASTHVNSMGWTNRHEDFEILEGFIQRNIVFYTKNMRMSTFFMEWSYKHKMGKKRNSMHFKVANIDMEVS